jgi:hypothetical protein
MKRTAVLMITALVLVIGCKKTDEAATGTTTSASKTPTTSVPAKPSIDHVVIGHEVGAYGEIVAGQTGTNFAPGQIVYVALQLSAPAGTAVKIVFYGPGDKKVAEETKKVAGGETFMTFNKATKGWPKGDYRAEVSMGDEKVNTQPFQIVDASKGGK